MMNEANNEPGMEGMDEMSCNDNSNSDDNDPQMGGMGKVHIGGYQSKHLANPKNNNDINNNNAIISQMGEMGMGGGGGGFQAGFQYGIQAGIGN